MGRVDVNVPKFNQAMVAVLTAAAFVGQWPWVVGVAFGLLAPGAIGGARWAPLSRLYVSVIRPRIPEGRAIVTEPAAPPRFAQIVGTVVLGAALVAFILGATAAGWAATLVVTSLAALAVLTDVCVGCLVYEKVAAR